MNPEQQIDAIRILYRLTPEEDTIQGLHKRFIEAAKENLVTIPEVYTSVRECLLTKDPLLAFAAWYTTWVNGNIYFAQHFGVTETKLGMGITLFCCPPFQVQMYLFKSEAVIPSHKHPNVESYEVYVAGDMELTKDDGTGRLVNITIKEFVARDEYGRTKCNGGMMRIPAASSHGGHINKSPLGPFGGAFLSIQYWLNEVAPKPIQFDWAGHDGSKEG